MTKKKDPNSRSGKIRDAIKLFPGYSNSDIAKLTDESVNLVCNVRKNMFTRKRKPKVVDAKIEPMVISDCIKNELKNTTTVSVFGDPTDADEEKNMAVMQEQSKANAVQIGGQHYQSKAIQPWDYIASNNLGYLEGNVVKYVSRWKEKGGVEDLKKAAHYLAKLIEVNE